MLHKSIGKSQRNSVIDPVYGSADVEHDVPKYRMPEQEMPARNAYNIVRDELMLDGNSRLNLATFVSTWMEPEAKQLIGETLDKNMIDKDEYPQTAEIEYRCVNIIADLWHAQGKDHKACGCSTVGSSEAAMLGGMALKWNWRDRLQKAGKTPGKPNLIMSEGVQVCWEKFCRYWEIEARMIPFEPGTYTITPEKVIDLCDENTIGVIAIMGTTQTGEYEPVKEINDALDKLNTETNWNIPIHVDAASGGFIAPFLQPELEWDFRLKWVCSINASGHKFGLVYPGVGWVVWRSRKELHEDLIFHVNYLGGDMPTFALNFSRPGAQVCAQYYNFLRLGMEGYRKIQANCRSVCLYLADELEKTGLFECISKGHDIPVITCKMREGAAEGVSVFDVSRVLRYRGWLIPAYTLAKNADDIAVLRIVVKNGFSRDLANLLIEDINHAIDDFNKGMRMPQETIPEDSSFHKHC